MPTSLRVIKKYGRIIKSWTTSHGTGIDYMHATIQVPWQAFFAQSKARRGYRPSFVCSERFFRFASWMQRFGTPPEELMRVIIADDHPIVLVGLRLMLQNHCTDCQVIGEVHSSAALLAFLADHPCDLVVTDFSMPADGESLDGLEMLRRLRECHPRLGVIILTMSSNPALIRGMLAAGAKAVVEKTAMTKELTLAVQTVCAGRSYVSEQLRKRLAEGSAESAARGGDESAGVALSMREAEIMRMLARGMTVTEIAKVTCRSIKTISQQKHDAMRKLCIDSDSQLFEYMRTHGI